MSAVVPSASTRAYGWGSAAIWIVGPELSNRTKLVAVAWLGDLPAGASSAWMVNATGVPSRVPEVGARGIVNVHRAPSALLPAWGQPVSPDTCKQTFCTPETSAICAETDTVPASSPL